MTEMGFLQAFGRGRRAAVALAVVAAIFCVPAAGAATPSYGTHSDDTLAPCATGTVDCPASDSFYRAPSNLASLHDGALVGVRPATISGGDPGKTALTISYRSEDSFGAPVLDIATVFLPSSAYIGPGGQPLVSYQFPIDSLGGQCAPSYSFAHGTNENVSTSDIQPLLSAGYAVVAPDFDGPAEQFIAGQQEGHAVLDGIRAAESLPAAGLSPGTRVALDGYSGGAHATGWAQELAASYAPDLNIVAAAEGGTPADLTATGNYLDGTVFFGLDFLSNGGLIRAFPATGIQNHFNAKGQAALAAANTECVNQALTAYPYQHFNDYTTTPDVIGSPTVQALLTHEKLGQSAPHFPIFSYHVYNDEIVPFTQDVALLKYYCANNVSVDFVTLSGDHVSGEFEGAPLVSAYLQAVFVGATPPSDCATAVAAAEALPQVPPITAPSSGSGGSSGSSGSGPFGSGRSSGSSGSGSFGGGSCRVGGPVVHAKARISETGIRAQGVASNHGCGGRITSVGVALARSVGHRCRFLRSNGTFAKPTSCRPRDFLRAHGTTHWTYRRRRRLAKSVYLLWAHATNSKRKTTHNTAGKHIFLRLR
jgi:uncharacterized membrane protein YgcG